MLVYLCVFILLVAFYVYSEKVSDGVNLFSYFCAGAVLFIVAAFREDSVWKDAEVYMKLIRQAPSAKELLFHPISYFFGNTRIEPAMKIIVNVSNFISKNHNFHVFCLIFAFLGVLAKMYSFKKVTALFWGTLLMYSTNLFYIHEMTQIRAGVATAFVIMAIFYINSREFYKYFFFICLGASFHYSAFMALPLYFLDKDRLNLGVWLLLLVLSVVFYLCSSNLITKFLTEIDIPILTKKLQVYMVEQKKTCIKINPFNVIIIFQFATSVFLSFFKDRLVKENPYFIFFVKMNLVSVLSYYLFGIVPVFSFRVSEFFGIAQIFLFPMVVYVIKPKWIAQMLVVLAALAVMYINIVHLRLLDGYESWLF